MKILSKRQNGSKEIHVGKEKVPLYYELKFKLNFIP